MIRMLTIGFMLIAVCLCCGIASAGNADVETLTITGGDQATLEALSAYPNLKSLTLADCPALDLTPLAACTRLTNLTIAWTNGYAGNGAYDLAPLQKCARLNTLTLIGRGVSDLSPLTGVPKLTSLTLKAAATTDYSPVAKLGLKHLRLYGADAEAVAAVFSAVGRKLESAVVGDCTLTSAANDAILSSTRLVSLGFENAEAIDGKSARWAKLLSLTSLTVAGGSVSSLEFLDSYVATVAVKMTDVFVGGAVCSVDFDKYFLKTADVPDAELLKLVRGDGRRWQYVTIRNQSESLSSGAVAAFSRVPGLLSLDIQANAADALASDVWEDFSKLEQLKLSGGETVTLDMLSSIPSLARLSIRDAAVYSAEKIGGLQKLQQLSLVLCTLDGWSFLNRLGDAQITLLNLSGCNGPESLEGIKDLDKLKILALENAPVTDLEPLTGLKLTSLYLYGCDIADYAPLGTLLSLRQLTCNTDAVLPALSCRVLRRPVIALP